MTITRVIDGVEHSIELTGREMINAYFEQQFEYDKQDIIDELNSYSKDSHFEDIYECTLAEMTARIDDAAIEMRRNIDKYDMGWYDARELAISDVAARIIREREQVSES